MLLTQCAVDVLRRTQLTNIRGWRDRYGYVSPAEAVPNGHSKVRLANLRTFERRP